MVTVLDIEAVQAQECLISVGGACGYGPGYEAGSGAGAVATTLDETDRTNLMTK